MIFQAPDGSGRVGCDLPSSLMSRLGSAGVEAAAQKLDATLVPFMEDLTGAAASIEQRPVRYREQASSKSYEELAAGFEAVVGDAEGGRFTNALQAATDAADWEKICNGILGSSGFLRIFSMDHGHWAGFFGVAGKGKLYIYGNPVTAHVIPELDLRAGAQITLRMLIWEGPDGTGRISYDVPSTLWQHLHNDAIDDLTARLDQKLATFFGELAGAAT